MNHSTHHPAQVSIVTQKDGFAETINNIFSQSGFMPHGHCYLWKPFLVSLHVLSDALIGLAYISISITLYILVKRIQLPFNKIVLCFGVFIGACGLTHFMEIWNLWNADYWWSAWIKVITAIASVGTGIYLFQLRHAIVQVAEAAKLAEQRRLDLEALTIELERRVEERTAQLSESEEEFRTLVNSIPQLAWVADQEGNSTWINKQWYNYTGLPEGDVQSWSKAFHEEDLKFISEIYARAIKEKKSAQYEARIRNAEGDYRWFLIQLLPFKNAKGEVTKWFGTNTDIHEQKMRNQELQASVKKRDEFITVASHEIKTPLTSMKMQLQMTRTMMEKNNYQIYDPDKIKKMFEVSNRQIDRLTRLVDDMLDASLVSGGNLTLFRENVNLNDIVQTVIDRLTPQFEISNNTVVVMAKETIIGNWDAFRLEQVLMNLFTNSIKYAAGSKIEVMLEKTQSKAILKVRDYGIGIAKDQQHKIFSRFERAISAKNISGLGLGLYISKEILNRHGGSIRVDSELGKGAMFIIELPIEVGHGL